MERLSMDQSLIRGAAAALIALELLAAPSANAQGGAVQARPARDTAIVMRVQGRQMGDSIFMRVFDAPSKAKIDTIMLKWRSLDDESVVSDQSRRIRREMEALFTELSAQRAAGATFMFQSPDIRHMQVTRLKGWIGLTAGLAPREDIVDSAGGYYVHYYRYPSIVSVEPNSPAHRAGIAAGDVLIAYDGQDVVRNRVKMSELLVPDRKLDVTVRRDGESQNFSLIVAKTPERIAIRRLDPSELGSALPPEGPLFWRGRGGGLPGGGLSEGPVQIELRPVPGAPTFNRVSLIERNGILGMGLVTVSAELSRTLKLDKGVLVQDCGEETPAFRGGLRTGDIIVSVAGQTVNTVGDVQSVVFARRNERVMSFQIVREKKPVTLNVKW
ncbi:MAG TPA: PDZ domain-containing protein [Gemmatimonadaceae bacterium]